MNDTVNAKQLIRKKIIAKRENFNENLYQTANQLICRNILKLINFIKKDIPTFTISIYYPMRAEPDLFKLIFLTNNQFALPIIVGSEMNFAKYHSGDILEKTTFPELKQPLKKSITIPHIIIAPGLVFSVSGYRIGFGLGYYDKYFAKIKQPSAPISIGVCFHDYLIESLPYSENDHKFNYIITEKMLITI